MDKEKAIEVINGHIKDSSVAYGTFTGQALRMAVEALKAQLSQEGTTKDATSDLISRQAAIKAVNNAFDRETLLTGFVRSIAVRAIRDMPSAQINLNERIKVKLTDYGKEIYYHRFDDMFRQTELSVFKPEFPKTDEEGYTTFRLWDFIHIYGNYIDMCLPAVIKPLEIVYVGD